MTKRKMNQNKKRKRGHVGQWLDVDGEHVHILADPNMSEETAEALRKLVRAVRKQLDTPKSDEEGSDGKN